MFLRGFLAGIACASASWYSSTYLVHNETFQSINIDYEEPAQKSKNELLKFGAPFKAPEKNYYTNHVLSYNWEKRIPHWVIELLEKNKLEGLANRQKSNFKSDPHIMQMFSAQNEDYSRSGWSRGHMAAAGNHKYDQQAMDDTFYLSNIVPQNIDNNSGFWNRFEMYCRDLTKKFEKVWVVSGPLFVSYQEGDKRFVKYQVIGKSEIAVPTHLYKIILTKNYEDLNLSAFVVPNKPIPNEKKLNQFQVPIEYVESKSGLIFYPRLERLRSLDLCKVEGCEMLDWQAFQLHFITRKMHSSNNLDRLEEAFDEIKSKRLTPDSEALEVYTRKKREFLAMSGGEDKHKEAARTRG